jgi:hypothetical protein
MASVPSDQGSSPSHISRPIWGRWFRAPYRLLIGHTALILAFMIALYWNWTDFTPQAYDCVYLPYFLISGPLSTNGPQKRTLR